jgi:hypothetical protein
VHSSGEEILSPAAIKSLVRWMDRGSTKKWVNKRAAGPALQVCAQRRKKQSVKTWHGNAPMGVGGAVRTLKERWEGEVGDVEAGEVM